MNGKDGNPMDMSMPEGKEPADNGVTRLPDSAGAAEGAEVIDQKAAGERKSTYKVRKGE
jgi:hypothetical protein